MHKLITELSEFDAIVLANGEHPTHHIPLSLLDLCHNVVCCDGAGAKYISNGKMPLAIIGDGDSLPLEFKEKHQEIFHHIAEQEDNDLTKATRFLMTHTQARTIAYLGSTGMREDHTIANISLMMRYYKEFHLLPVMITDYGWFVPTSGKQIFETFPKQQVSIFNFSCKHLTSKGLRWNSYAYQQFWQGSLNEAIDKAIEMDGDGDYLMYFTFDAKK